MKGNAPPPRGPRDLLSEEEIARYGRHLVLPEVGREGQERLKAGSALIVGAGGLGSPIALYLAAAGVGRIGIIDFDRVDPSNLQRQVLYETADVGKPKALAAARRIASINPHIVVEPYDERLGAGSARKLLGAYDVVLDGSDNFPTRYLVNDACVLLGKPNVYGSIFRFEGQATVFDARVGPCYRCLFPEPPPEGTIPSCADAGVLGVLPALIGSIQATEAIKILLGAGETLVGRLLLYDALHMNFKELRLRKDPSCPVCGESPTIRTLDETVASCGAPAGADAPAVLSVEPRALEERLRAGEPLLLLDVREPFEAEICRLAGSILVPPGEMEKRLAEFDRGRTVVCYCHTGVRSYYAAHLLVSNGFRRVENLSGGIDAWAAEVDPAMSRY
ncbi:MAG: molybdopterin-synthase adenylyltransferase MoeB [Candidatus Latescibacterota bacterium]|nr:MAG: molybdopterin-synthase adenylyltransferase MoeB [Candidatus Latescibacterota bacterium]